MTPEEVRHVEAPDTEHCSCVPHLRAEIERLRERLEIRIQHGHNLRTMLESATDTERAAVVAYLREEASHTGASPDERTILRWVANYIERGEHRREEER